MQVLIALPELETLQAAGRPQKVLGRRICGIPLLTRTIVTTIRSGGTKVLLAYPRSFPEDRLRACLKHAAIPSAPVEMIALDRAFDPDDASTWQPLAGRLEPKFLWMPWNLVLDKRRLSPLAEAGLESGEGVRIVPSEDGRQADVIPPPAKAAAEAPLVVVKSALGLDGRAGRSLGEFAALESLQNVSVPHGSGVVVWSKQDAHNAERDLIRWSGKDWDGMFSKFNRRLCWPLVRLLSKTPVTPNMVTFAGLLGAILAAYVYTRGHWAAYALGGFVFFVSVLFDEIDGMLARIKFQDSPFGCWLESFVDYASYILVYSGIIIGLYRQSGPKWLWWGGLLLFGVVASIFTVVYQRKLATDPDKPHEYQIRLYNHLEKDYSNTLSRFTRELQFLIKKAVFAHHLLYFSVLGILKLHLVLSAPSASLVWILALYHNRLFRRKPQPEPAVARSSGGTSQ